MGEISGRHEAFCNADINGVYKYVRHHGGNPAYQKDGLTAMDSGYGLYYSNEYRRWVVDRAGLGNAARVAAYGDSFVSDNPCSVKVWALHTDGQFLQDCSVSIRKRKEGCMPGQFSPMAPAGAAFAGQIGTGIGAAPCGLPPAGPPCPCAPVRGMKRGYEPGMYMDGPQQKTPRTAGKQWYLPLFLRSKGA